MSQPTRQQIDLRTFSLREQRAPDDEAARIVVVRGELDLFTAPELRDRLREHVDARRLRLVVDLTDCSFVDASGCQVLLTASRRLAAHGGRLAIVNTDAAIARIFSVMGLDDLFPVVTARAAAIAALRSAPA